MIPFPNSYIVRYVYNRGASFQCEEYFYQLGCEYLAAISRLGW